MIREKPTERTISHLVDLLIENGLLTKTNGPPILYKTTQEGVEVLKRLAEIEGSEPNFSFVHEN